MVSGLNVRGLGGGVSLQLLAKPPAHGGECGGRLKEGIRKRDKR